MPIDVEILEMLISGLNNLEGGKEKSFTIEGLTIVEAQEIKDFYLTNYNVNTGHSMNLRERYLLNISKK